MGDLGFSLCLALTGCILFVASVAIRNWCGDADLPDWFKMTVVVVGAVGFLGVVLGLILKVWGV